MAKKYNQISIFDLETLEDIKTGGTGENVEGLPNEQQRIQDLNNLLKPKETITAQEIKTAGKKPRQKIKNFFKKYFTPKGLLNEETFGKNPSMGHIRYGIDNSPHEVIWDAKLKNLVKYGLIQSITYLRFIMKPKIC